MCFPTDSKSSIQVWVCVSLLLAHFGETLLSGIPEIESDTVAIERETLTSLTLLPTFLIIDLFSLIRRPAVLCRQ